MIWFVSITTPGRSRLRVGHFEPWEIEKMRGDFKAAEALAEPDTPADSQEDKT